MGDTERPTMLTKHPYAGTDGAQGDAPRPGRETGRGGCKTGDLERQQLQNQQPRNAESKSVSIWGQCNRIQTSTHPKAKINLSGRNNLHPEARNLLCPPAFRACGKLQKTIMEKLNYMQ